MESTDQHRIDRSVAGGLLVGSAALAVILMGHHPTAASGVAMMRGMHGAILTVMLVEAVGFFLFVRQRGVALADVGMFLFAVGLVGGMGAGMVDGFVVPAMIERVPVEENRTLFAVLWQINQALAKGGVLLTSLAYGLWAADMWRNGWRWTAVMGLAAALFPAIALLSGILTMDIKGATICYTIQAGWAVWLGITLLRGRPS